MLEKYKGYLKDKEAEIVVMDSFLHSMTLDDLEKIYNDIEAVHNFIVLSCHSSLDDETLYLHWRVTKLIKNHIKEQSKSH